MFSRASIILLAQLTYFEENTTRRLIRTPHCLFVCVTSLSPESPLSLLGNGTLKSFSATSTHVGCVVSSEARVVSKESRRLVFPRTSSKILYQNVNIMYGLLCKGEESLYNGGTSRIVLLMENTEDGPRSKTNVLITYSLVNKYCW
jgi:hypothetical protein